MIPIASRAWFNGFMVEYMKHVFAVILYFASGIAQAEERSVVLSVPGMKCPACPITIMVAIKRVNGVRSVYVDFENKSADVSFDDQLTSIARIQEAAKSAGFTSAVVSAQE